MSDAETTIEEVALTRLRAILDRTDRDVDELDDDELLALARGELGSDAEKALLAQLAHSASLRVYLVEASRPVDEARAERALAAMGVAGSVPLVVDPFDDPLGPEPPRGYAVHGPFGRLRASMDSRADGDRTPRFGPNSEIEWTVHADERQPLPDEVSVWRRAPGGAYERISGERIERADGALRVTIAAAHALPTPGTWSIVLLLGSANHPTEAAQQEGAQVSEALVHFERGPSDESL